MKIIDPGHVYSLSTLGGDDVIITFVKRSGGAVTYQQEWPGLQSQEVIRALIDRTQYLDNVLECYESKDAIYHLRMALYSYELRAWRRKQEAVNKQAPEHDDTHRPKPWREFPHEAPFNEYEIELLPVGLDGHVLPNKK